MNELNEQDFARGVKNPYFNKIMTKTEIALRNEDLSLFQEVGKMNGVPAELIMRNCLADWAEKMRKHE